MTIRVGGEHYSMSVSDMETPERFINRLNVILSRIQLRQDRLEGVRGTAAIRAPLQVIDTDGNVIGGFTTS